MDVVGIISCCLLNSGCANEHTLVFTVVTTTTTRDGRLIREARGCAPHSYMFVLILLIGTETKIIIVVGYPVCNFMFLSPRTNLL